jgi:hypothetical protein
MNYAKISLYVFIVFLLHLFLNTFGLSTKKFDVRFASVEDTIYQVYLPPIEVRYSLVDSLLPDLKPYQADIIKTIYDVSKHQDSIPVSIKISQGILESNWGRNYPMNNLYGITGKCSKPYKDKLTGRYRRYRCYDTLEESIRDHDNVLYLDYYKSAHYSLNYNDWLIALKPYAEDKKYSQKLKSIIKKYKLHKLDVIQQNHTKIKNYGENTLFSMAYPER